MARGPGLDDGNWEHYGYKSWQVVVKWVVDLSNHTHLEAAKAFFGQPMVEI